MVTTDTTVLAQRAIPPDRRIAAASAREWTFAEQVHPELKYRLAAMPSGLGNPVRLRPRAAVPFGWGDPVGVRFGRTRRRVKLALAGADLRLPMRDSFARRGAHVVIGEGS